MKRLFALLLLVLAPSVAGAATVTLPYLFSPGETIYSSYINADYAALTGTINGNIDNTNVGSAGFFASQIKPTTVAQAAFGGTQTYSFPASAVLGGTSSTNQVEVGAVNASSAHPTFNNSGDGGLNETIASGSATGIRYFKYDGTTTTLLAALGLTGNFTASGSISAGGNLYAVGNVYADDGTFAAPSGTQLAFAPNNTVEATLSTSGVFNSQGLVAASVTDTGLTNGSCVQASTGGQLVTTGATCGQGTPYSVTINVSSTCNPGLVCTPFAAGPSGTFGACTSDLSSSTGFNSSYASQVIPKTVQKTGGGAGAYVGVYNIGTVSIPSGTTFTVTGTCQ